MIVSSLSCVRSETTLPPDKIEVAWGKAGEAPPSELWSENDWILATREYAMEKFIGR